MRFMLAAAAALAIAVPASAEDMPDLTGFWNAPIQAFDMPADLEARLPPDTVVLDDSGAAEFPRGVYGGLKLTPQAAAHAETWRAEDDMTLTRACLPPSIVY